MSEVSDVVPRAVFEALLADYERMKARAETAERERAESQELVHLVQRQIHTVMWRRAEGVAL